MVLREALQRQSRPRSLFHQPTFRDSSRPKVQQPRVPLALAMGVAGSAKILQDAAAMTEEFAPPRVTIRRYSTSPICDVVVVFRGREMVVRCPSYAQAFKWARLECKSYKIPEPDIEPPGNAGFDDVPLFLRSPRESS
jgi:hypothetical protein